MAKFYNVSPNEVRKWPYEFFLDALESVHVDSEIQERIQKASREDKK
ncbi:hypothetical protein vBYenM636_68 [Yersinia phage vB_YenM_636]|nr:hypothetical protein X1_78 [Yersinia phage vB_Yen_X1]QKN86319.1 hypothetical protein vBYenM12_68 [Yersinia phage vB_YenM_12]QKN86410.1 hypothetical protein vBYenM22_68 [Yersinia phage vB_YenM_22]QKN86501.1 hypothetical protein vBYenM25_68 [Yersinia phage vB_YenM_25]QKN86592.1 hypothetical protein vBYenM27_68 [Yersinia phage vB_YenM_27]QKN86683.1 hypothetical protein vBYenM39_68 [Yersinia phage vB_YenM_39]QKN86774.1 hypothetical protein vBYenM126_68 [Yersinia phage vB_YenM_126]QKN86865.1 h